MEKIKLPFFGKISIDKTLVEQDYQVYEKIDESLVEFNLNFETESTTIDRLNTLKSFLTNFRKYSKDAKLAIRDNFIENDIVKEFVKIHVDALTPFAKEVILDTFAKSSTLENFMFEEIELDHVYTFPDSDDDFMKLCYRISEDLADEILFVRFGPDFQIKEISIEY